MNFSENRFPALDLIPVAASIQGHDVSSQPAICIDYNCANKPPAAAMREICFINSV